MKRLGLVVGLIALMAFIVPGNAAAGQNIAQFTIGSRNYIAAGQSYKMDVAPYINNNRSYVPIRYIANALGIPDENIIWDAATQSVYLNYASKEVKFVINSNIVWKNGIAAVIDVSPEIKSNRAFLPARYVAEAFGATVAWDQSLKSVTIHQATTTNPNPSAVSDTMKYQWEYKGLAWTWESNINQDQANQVLEYYSSLPHPHRTHNDYVKTYCMDRTDDSQLKSIVNILKNGAEKQGYDKFDTVGMVIAFVQSFTYVSDSNSTGIDEYPRYPLETLLAREGDCEDTSILTATLLRELGYGTALIFFDTHCAVGIKGSESLAGSYYIVNGSRYYYVETTSKGWNIGEIPDEYKNQDAIVLPLP